MDPAAPASTKFRESFTQRLDARQSVSIGSEDSRDSGRFTSVSLATDKSDFVQSARYKGESSFLFPLSLRRRLNSGRYRSKGLQYAFENLLRKPRRTPHPLETSIFVSRHILPLSRRISLPCLSSIPSTGSVLLIPTVPPTYPHVISLISRSLWFESQRAVEISLAGDNARTEASTTGIVSLLNRIQRE